MSELKLYKVKVYELKTSSKSGKVYEKYYTRLFFKSEAEVDKFKKDRKSCIDAGIGSQETYKIEIGSFNQFRDEITLTDYSLLFGTTIQPNNRLTLDELFQGMWVWDATIGRYTQIAARIVYAPDPIDEIKKRARGMVDISKIIRGSDVDIGWYSEDGVCIDDHLLYRYPPDPYQFTVNIQP